MIVNRIIVVGGGSAGFLAAITLKGRLPQVDVSVIRSREIGIIGVGEGSTGILPAHLHGYLGISYQEFFAKAEPVWKLGLRFIWGPRPFFDYSFSRQFNQHFPQLYRPVGFFCDHEGAIENAGLGSALMSQNKAFARRADGQPAMDAQIAYHLENVKFVGFLEEYAQRLGVRIVDDTIVDVRQNDAGIASLKLAAGGEVAADLYVDCSGFASLLLGKTLGEPFVPFKSSLYCDRAVVGGWERQEEPIKPYTTAETMDCGWCWEIEHERRINRGYVYCSDFISDADAEAEFRRKNPKVASTRVVKFRTGRYERAWLKNVVAIGNAGGFVEPLESTSLGAICTESVWLASGLADTDREIRPSVVKLFNRRMARNWDSTRGFLALHYKFNTRLDTPFWAECRQNTDLAQASGIAEHCQQNGPSLQWWVTLLDPEDQFTAEGYLAMLVGQRVPYRILSPPSEAQRATWERMRSAIRATASAGFTVPEALVMVRSPQFQWPSLYPRVLPGV
ncbi:MAG TPA: tryptophan halogenase family protein [Tepidisphaeraceae bacterium]|nr:tryptophan halogenase family protein [Tepidisphaeraceae bacterium]